MNFTLPQNDVLLPCLSYIPGLFPAILGKGPWQKLGKMIDLTSKLGEINDIEHNKGSKIYPQNQVILDCIMPSIPLIKHKCLSINLSRVIDLLKSKKTKKNKQKKRPFFIGKIRVLYRVPRKWEIKLLFSIGNGPNFGPIPKRKSNLEKGRKCTYCRIACVCVGQRVWRWWW